MPDALVFFFAALLAASFGWAALAKLAGFDRWRRALAGYGLPPRLELVARVATPPLEAGIALLVLVGPLPLAGALALVLLAGFCIVILQARSIGGDRVPCGCFGGTSERDYRLMLLRNTLLAVACGIVVVGESDGLIERAASIAVDDLLPLALVVVATGLIGWMLKGVSESLSTRGRRT